MPQRDLSNLPKVKNPDSDGDSCLCLKLSAYTNLLVKTFAKYHCIFMRGEGSDHLLQSSRSTAVSSGLFPVMVQRTGMVSPTNWKSQPHSLAWVVGCVSQAPQQEHQHLSASLLVRTPAGPGPLFSAA